MNYLLGRPATTTTATPLLSQAVSVKGPGPGAEEKHVRPKPERNMFLSPPEIGNSPSKMGLETNRNDGSTARNVS